METDHRTTLWTGHNGAIYDLLFWPKVGQWITSGGDGLVVAWPNTGEAEGQGEALFHHHEAFFALGIWRDALVAGSAGGELFMKRQTGSTIEAGTADVKRWKAHDLGVFVLASIESDVLLSGGGDGQGRLWGWRSELEDLGPAWSGGFDGKVRCVVSGPPGHWLVGSSDGTGRMWDRKHLRLSAPVMHHAGGMYCGMWHAAKKVWITGGRDGHLRVTQPNGHEVLALPAHEGAIYRIATYEQWLWTAGRDGQIKVWDLRGFEALHKIGVREGGHKRSVNALGLRKTTTGQIELLSGGEDRSVILHHWDGH